MKTAISLIFAALVLVSLTVDVWSDDIFLPLVRVAQSNIGAETATATVTATTDASSTPTVTGTPPATATTTATSTSTRTPTATATGQATATHTATSTATRTATATSTATATATATQPAGGPCPCHADVMNCGNFDTHDQAQACFNYCVSQGAGDIHRLDQDNDSDACESLPLFYRVLN